MTRSTFTARLFVASASLAIALASGAQQPAGSNAAARDLPPFAVADQSAYHLVYDHLTGETRLLSENRELRGRWGSRVASSVPGRKGIPAPTVLWGEVMAAVPPDRPMLVEIENANPLLYRYEVEVAPIRSLKVRTCATVGGEFVQQGFVASVAAARGMVFGPPQLDSLFRGQLTSDQLVGKLTAGQDKGFGKAFTRAEWVEVREGAERLVAFTARVDEIQKSLETALPSIAERGEFEPVDHMLQELQDSIAGVYPGLESPRKVPHIVFQEIAAARPNIRTVVRLASGASKDNATLAYAAEAVSLKGQVDSALARLVPAYRKLQLLLIRVERARALTHQSFTIAPSGDLRKVVLSLNATDDFADIPRTSAGSVVFFAKPAVRLMCQLSLGLAYMAQPARYEVQDGTVVNSREDEMRTTAAIMLSLSPASWDHLAATTGIGIGVNKTPDLYLGASLRVLPSAFLNAGAVWQREQRIPDGLVAPVKATAAEVKRFPRSYRAGWFGGISLIR